MIFLSFENGNKKQKWESRVSVYLYISDTYQRNEEQTMRKETLKKHVKNSIENDEFASDLNAVLERKKTKKKWKFEDHSSLFGCVRVTVSFLLLLIELFITYLIPVNEAAELKHPWNNIGDSTSE